MGVVVEESDGGRPVTFSYVTPTAEQLADVFRWWHKDRVSLSEIGRRLRPDNPLPYRWAGHILRGDILADETAELRDRWPPYDWQRGQSAKLNQTQLNRLFRVYHGCDGGRVSLDDAARSVGLSRPAATDILTGRTCAAQTVVLRRRYGDQVRPQGAAGRPGRAA